MTVVMPYKDGSTSPKERAFIEASGRGLVPKDAAAVAQYADPEVAAWKLMSNEFIGDAARRAARDVLRNQGAQTGVAVLMSIALDKAQPAGARVTAARSLVQLSGIAGEEKGSSDPSEMTLEELRRATEKTRMRANLLEHALADAAAPVLEGKAVKASVLD